MCCWTCVSPHLFFPFHFSVAHVLSQSFFKSELPLCFRALYVMNWKLKSVSSEGGKGT